MRECRKNRNIPIQNEEDYQAIKRGIRKLTKCTEEEAEELVNAMKVIDVNMPI